jgi:hypothetical protein
MALTWGPEHTRKSIHGSGLLPICGVGTEGHLHCTHIRTRARVCASTSVDMHASGRHPPVAGSPAAALCLTQKQLMECWEMLVHVLEESGPGTLLCKQRRAEAKGAPIKSNRTAATATTTAERVAA